MYYCPYIGTQGVQTTTVKPLLRGPPIKRTPSIKRTLCRVPKLMSHTFLFTLLSGLKTELTKVVLDNVLEIRTVLDK